MHACINMDAPSSCTASSPQSHAILMHNILNLLTFMQVKQQSEVNSNRAKKTARNVKHFQQELRREQYLHKKDSRIAKDSADATQCLIEDMEADLKTNKTISNRKGDEAFYWLCMYEYMDSPVLCEYTCKTKYAPLYKLMHECMDEYMQHEYIYKLMYRCMIAAHIHIYELIKVWYLHTHAWRHTH